MNIFNKVAVQGLKKSRTRTVVTIIGVVLSAAMITAVTTFGISLLHYMADGAMKKYGAWHVAFTDVPSSFVQEQAGQRDVKDTTAIQNIGYAALEGNKNPDKPYLFITGFGEKAFRTLPVNLISGRLPENSEEILVPGSVNAKSGVKISVGDKLSLAVGNRMKGSKALDQHSPYTAGETLVSQNEKTYTVVGISQTPSFEESGSPGYTLITKTDPQYKADSFSLFVTLTNPRNIHAYADSNAKNYAYSFNDNVLRFMGLSDDNVFNALLYSVGGIVIIIIMTGSIFLIYNAFNISLNERIHQFGILLSAGATARQLRNSVLFEGLCIGAIGIPIGILAGLGSMGLVLSVVSEKFVNILYDTVPLTLQVSAPAIAAALVVSLVTILISAYIPARKAAGTPVMECIRQTNEVKVEGKAIKISKFSQRIYGLEGTLALKNFKRNKKRCRSVVLSLVLSIVLFISASSFVMYMKQTSEQTAEHTTYDIAFATQNMDDENMLSLYDKLKTADGVYESSYQALMGYSCTAKDSSLTKSFWKSTGTHSPGETVRLPMEIQFLDDKTYLHIIHGLGLSADEYTGQNGKMIAVGKMQDNSDKAENAGQLSDMFKSTSMNFTIAPETAGAADTNSAPGAAGAAGTNSAPEAAGAADANNAPETASSADTNSAPEAASSADTNNAPDTAIGSQPERGLNVSITFVDTVPPDTLPTMEKSKPRPYIFRVLAPYSLKGKFETPDAHADIKGLTFRSKNAAKSAAEMRTIIQDEGITDSYNLYNMSKMLDENRNMIFIANVFAYTFIVIISLIAAANVFNTISTNIRLRRRELAMLRSVGMSERAFQKMMNFECAFYGMRALLFGLPIALLSSWLIYKGMAAGGAEDIHFALPLSSIGISVFSVLFIVFITMLYAISRIKKENIIDALRDDMA